MSEQHRDPRTQPNILILADGNRRWAQAHGNTFEKAYHVGASRIVETCHYLEGLGMKQAWFGIGRPFNFGRDPEEFRRVFDACLSIPAIAEKRGHALDIRTAGQLDRLPQKYQTSFERSNQEAKTGTFLAHLLLGWSLQTDLESFKKHVSEEPLEKQLLDSSAVKEPIDFVIRTGASRLSEMIPPHSTGAELKFFPEILFPDFTTDNLQTALDDYASRGHRNQLVVPLPSH